MFVDSNREAVVFSTGKEEASVLLTPGEREGALVVTSEDLGVC
jgi:hypothetical protein